MFASFRKSFFSSNPVPEDQSKEVTSPQAVHEAQESSFHKHDSVRSEHSVQSTSEVSSHRPHNTTTSAPVSQDSSAYGLLGMEGTASPGNLAGKKGRAKGAKREASPRAKGAKREASSRGASADSSPRPSKKGKGKSSKHSSRFGDEPPSAPASSPASPVIAPRPSPPPQEPKKKGKGKHAAPEPPQDVKEKPSPANVAKKESKKEKKKRTETPKQDPPVRSADHDPPRITTPVVDHHVVKGGGALKERGRGGAPTDTVDTSRFSEQRFRLARFRKTKLRDVYLSAKKITSAELPALLDNWSSALANMRLEDGEDAVYTMKILNLAINPIGDEGTKVGGKAIMTLGLRRS